MSEDVTILLVEDSALMRGLVRNMLRNFGNIRVLEACDGVEALAALKSDRVDLVLSDWNMQPMDGLHLLQAMRAIPALAAIPFVMMTADHTPQTISQAVAAGVTFYLSKPFGRDQLCTMVTDIVAGRILAA